MRIFIHIGMPEMGTDRLQHVLDDKREGLRGKGILFPRSPGGKNHTRLFMAVTDPAHIDPLRYNRGFITADAQEKLRDEVTAKLKAEVENHKPDSLILSASQLGASLVNRTELARLRDMLLPLSEDIRIVAHVDEQGRALTRHYAAQVLEGRAGSLTIEQELAGTKDWWDDCLLDAHQIDPQAGQFLETQAPPFWLDYTRLVTHWESVFGKDSVQLRPYDEALFYSPDVTNEICAAFGIEDSIGRAGPATAPDQPSAPWLTRARQLNELLLKVLKPRKRVLPRQMWRKFIAEVAIPGAPLAPGAFSELSKGFEKANKALLQSQPALTAECLKRDRALPTWVEADPEMGYRPSQYLLGFMWKIDKATREARDGKLADLETLTQPDAGKTAAQPENDDGLSPIAARLLPPLAKQNFAKLRHSAFAPHNKMGMVNEEDLAAAYSEIPMRKLPKGNSGNVIVGCMKNEAPYITEWVAYHRAMGVDNFLIYTNDCSDGTSEILDHLQDIGVLQHRNNDNWKGNSPQQYALNQALKEDLIKNAEWIIHIDVDEFINVRTGNGTLADFFAAVPDATNVAMTWRLFGHNGVTDLADEFVIDQFDSCAPKFCPKPHTVWGFKTMFRNIGAYQKISCHRPNKLNDGFRKKVKWVNGSGKDMTKEAAEKGWRSSKKSIGYDLIQLNHYALRSAESFLIKRQRGRALHVDRSIGLNYWIRMDWSDFRDLTIKRNLPRLRAEYDRLMADDTLRALHQKGLDWHREKADELHGMPEFQELYDQALKVKLNETERVAYALALDMES